MSISADLLVLLAQTPATAVLPSIQSEREPFSLSASFEKPQLLLKGSLNTN